MYKNQILKLMEEYYYDAKPELNFKNAYELLVATILSAQCTDVRVNKVTAELFKKYPDSKALSNAKIEELEQEIHSCGCYKVKAKNLIETSKKLVELYNGEVPTNMDQLTQLPGVGRKTANVVLSNAFGIPGLAVDTHVFRVSNRLGLAESDDVLKVEQQLCDIIPKEKWGKAHHWLIWHGRRICSARKPKCGECFLKNYCKYYLGEKI